MRNDACHYLHTIYTKVNIAGRLFVLSNKFNDMPMTIKNQFDMEQNILD